MPKKIIDEAIYRAEYSEVGAAMRGFADTRWKLISVVIPVSGGVLALATKFLELQLPMTIFGLFTGCLFAFIEYRTQLSWHTFFNHAVELERKMGIAGAYTKMVSVKHPWYRLDSTKGIRLAYFGLIAYWVYALVMIFV